MHGISSSGSSSSPVLLHKRSLSSCMLKSSVSIGESSLRGSMDVVSKNLSVLRLVSAILQNDFLGKTDHKGHPVGR